MMTCGYVCPACEGREYDENGNLCAWCFEEKKKTYEKDEDLKEWILPVHEGPCCSDS
ncbi:MAG TPA: hypothetical protein VD908_21345 [Cytophagales bacterium]|nr:hypothetical protein [Cytophagales bacterium]